VAWKGWVENSKVSLPEPPVRYVVSDEETTPETINVSSPSPPLAVIGNGFSLTDWSMMISFPVPASIVVRSVGLRLFVPIRSEAVIVSLPPPVETSSPA
jgi:hypothetical protein